MDKFTEDLVASIVTAYRGMLAMSLKKEYFKTMVDDINSGNIQDRKHRLSEMITSEGGVVTQIMAVIAAPVLNCLNGPDETQKVVHIMGDIKTYPDDYDAALVIIKIIGDRYKNYTSARRPCSNDDVRDLIRPS